MSTIRTNGRTLVFSHEDKLYFPDDHITKGEVIEYYNTISPLLLRHSRNRLLTLQRFPEGIAGTSFYQKDASEYFPAWIPTKHIAKQQGGATDYVICNNKATLLYIVNQGCITPHAWLSSSDKPNYPTTIIWDLDPAHDHPIDFQLIVQTATQLKALLESLGLTVWVMTTGSRGIHIRTLIKPEYAFDKVRSFARSVAQNIVTANPELLTLESRIAKRGKRLLIDVMRNSFGATAVVPYAIRPIPTAPIATPIRWEELNTPAMSSQKYTINSIQKYLALHGDAWQDMQRSRKSLKMVLKKLSILSSR